MIIFILKSKDQLIYNYYLVYLFRVMVCALKIAFDFTSLSFPQSDLDGLLNVPHCYRESTEEKRDLYNEPAEIAYKLLHTLTDI